MEVVAPLQTEEQELDLVTTTAPTTIASTEEETTPRHPVTVKTSPLRCCTPTPSPSSGGGGPNKPRRRLSKEEAQLEAARIIKLLALIAIESHGPFPSSSGISSSSGVSRLQSGRRLSKEEIQLEAARRERLLTYVDSLSDVLALEDSALRATVEAACQDGGLVTQSSSSSSSSSPAKEQGGEVYVVVRTVDELMEELLSDVRQACPSPMDSAWLALIVKVLITYQVRVNLYDARARASFRRLSQRLGPELLPWTEVVAIESALAEEYTALLSDSEADPPSCQSLARYFKVACAALGGGALMMYTGSVAAPSIAASLLALCTAGGMGMGPATAALTQQLTSSTAAVLSYWGLTSDVCISSFLAVTGVGLTGYKMTQRTRGITEFHFVPLHSSFPLHERQHCRRAMSPSSLSDDEDDKAVPTSEKGGATAAAAAAAGRGSAEGSHKGGTGGLPVFVCIPGWVEDDQDPRRVWGGATTTVSSPAKEDQWEAEMIDAVEESEAEEEGEGDDAMGQSSLSDCSWEALEVETSGWWREVVPGGEEHVLIWETQLLGQLHRAMREFVWHEASRYAIDEVIKHTALAGLTTAAALPLTVLDAARKLDNPWQLAVFHAQEAGQLLADVLVARPQGSRPVTLLGFSMGARVVFHCLEALHAKGESGLGIVENAVLLGLPLGRNADRWKQALGVVAGRLINGYSTRDWVLQFLFRSKAWELGLAGVGPVEGLEGQVENVDLTDMVPGHLSYPKALPNIMALLRLEE